MSSFFGKIKDDLSSIGNKLEKFGSEVIHGGESAVKYGVNTAKGFESGITSTIEIPLILIAGGIAFFLFNSKATVNSSDLATIASRVPI